MKTKVLRGISKRLCKVGLSQQMGRGEMFNLLKHIRGRTNAAMFSLLLSFAPKESSLLNKK
ncbi:MAG: hypothetical protein IJS29_04770 [Selenomonadaceae bacterium]|nr:hypothetical protein [Selenomonadaceae bacterium]